METLLLGWQLNCHPNDVELPPQRRFGRRIRRQCVSTVRPSNDTDEC